MFIFAILAACGSKQTEPEVPAVEAPGADDAAGAADEEAAAAALAADEAAADEEAAAAALAADEAAAGMAAGAGDCAPAAPIYTQVNAPLQAIDNAAMQWRLTVHDSGYWVNTSPNGEQTGCLTTEEQASLTTSLAAADISAPELEPGMARCMAMPMTQYTITIGEQTASWKGPCGMNNPSESLSALMTTIESVSYKRQ